VRAATEAPVKASISTPVLEMQLKIFNKSSFIYIAKFAGEYADDKIFVFI
jgi:hypothetical protein